MKPKKLILILHFIVLTMSVLNGVLEITTGYGLAGSLESIVEMAVPVTGLFLFFFFLRPFKKINIYFSFYFIGAVALILGILFRGIFWAVVMALILFPFIPEEAVYKNSDVVVYETFRGFLSPCCQYRIKERKAGIFEKDHGLLKADGWVDFETMRVQRSEKEIILMFKTDEADTLHVRKIPG